MQSLVVSLKQIKKKTPNNYIYIYDINYVCNLKIVFFESFKVN